ncbi:MAG: IMP dehydrogenase [Deltaproteobacteria bacterium]|nr:IMP dehydrogenase [Deltaproteobacteria bacterium]
MLREALTFQDVLLQPAYSEVLPSDVSTSTRLGKLELQIPILSAAMDTVTESDMAGAMAKAGGLGVVHKNLAPKIQASEVKQAGTPVAAAVGPGPELEERCRALIEAGVSMLVVDTAHGHSRGVLEACKQIKSWFPNITLTAGNIATAKAARGLIEAGVDAVKVGVGPGSICTTRIVTGVGVPQLSAILDVAQVTRPAGVSLIADGGISYSGDIVKALAAGADAVMLGSLLAGCEEAPGDRIEHDSKLWKQYRGMGSLTAMALGGKERYAQGNVREKKKLVPEGVEGLTPYRGPVDSILYQLIGGLRSGMGYLGANNLSELRENAEFVRITSAGLKESHVHGISVIQSPPNYHA